MTHEPGIPDEPFETRVWTPTLDELCYEVVSAAERLADEPQPDYTNIAMYMGLLPRIVDSVAFSEDFDLLTDAAKSALQMTADLSHQFLRSVHADEAFLAIATPEHLNGISPRQKVYLALRATQLYVIHNFVLGGVQPQVAELMAISGSNYEDGQLRDLIRQFGQAFPDIMCGWLDVTDQTENQSMWAIRNEVLVEAEKTVLALLPNID